MTVNMTNCPTPRRKGYRSRDEVPTADPYQCECGRWHARARRARGDGALYKTRNGRWVGRVELPAAADGTRRVKKVTSKNRNIVIAKLKTLRADAHAGRITASNRITAAQWLTRWLTEIHHDKIRPATYVNYEVVIRKHIIPAIGTRRLDQLTPTHIRHMHTTIGSTRNAQLAHTIVARALRDAEREGLINRNIAELVDKPSHVAAERAPLSAEQAKHLLRNAIETNDPFATRWAAALLLGARQGELLGLQWNRVDLNTGVADLSWQLQQLPRTHGCGQRRDDKTWPCGHKNSIACPNTKFELPRAFEYQMLDEPLALTRPKTKKSIRTVPIPAPLWALLQHHPVGDRNPHNLVWHRGDGRPIDRYADYQAWREALKIAGLPPVPLHVARHTTATLLLQAGVGEDIRMAILGHAGVAVHRGYAHVDLSTARNAMAGALNALLPPHNSSPLPPP